MITRIEIDGFKTFQDFAVDLAPFQVIIGANGCGKSNFFDALRLISDTVDNNVYASFRSLRGTQREHFTLLPGGESVPEMRICVEMLVEPVVQDEYGQKVTLQTPRLRYELEISQHNEQGTEWLHITRESLTSIPSGEDQWLAKYPALAGICPTTPATVEFISTSKLDSKDASIIFNSDKSGIEPRVSRTFLSRDLQTTILSSVHDCDSPHALAVRQEMQGCFFENIDASVMRLSTQFQYPSIPNDWITGNLIPAILTRLNMEAPAALNSISRAMSNLVPNLHKIEVAIENGGRVEIYAIMRDQRRFPIRVLSDGTLRLLALATLRHASGKEKVLCYEDPEEAVHPGVLKRLVFLMRDMTTDLLNEPQWNLPLRQLLVTTHSPELVSHLDVGAGELLYAEMVTRMRPGQIPMQVTRMTPVGQEIEGDKAAKSYTLNQVFAYLKNADYQTIRSDLQKVGV